MSNLTRFASRLEAPSTPRLPEPDSTAGRTSRRLIPPLRSIP